MPLIKQHFCASFKTLSLLLLALSGNFSNADNEYHTPFVETYSSIQDSNSLKLLAKDFNENGFPWEIVGTGDYHMYKDILWRHKATGEVRVYDSLVNSSGGAGFNTHGITINRIADQNWQIVGQRN